MKGSQMEGQEGTLCSAVGSSTTAEQKRGATTQKDYPKMNAYFRKFKACLWECSFMSWSATSCPLSVNNSQFCSIHNDRFPLRINCKHDSVFIYYRCFVRSVWVLGGEALYTVTGRLLKRRDWTGERAKYLAMKWKWFSGSQWQSL